MCINTLWPSTSICNDVCCLLVCPHICWSQPWVTSCWTGGTAPSSEAGHPGPHCCHGQSNWFQWCNWSHCKLRSWYYINVLYHMQGEMAQPYLGLGTESPWLSLGGPFLSSFAQKGLESSVYWHVLFVVLQISLPVWSYFSRHFHFQYLFVWYANTDRGRRPGRCGRMQLHQVDSTATRGAISHARWNTGKNVAKTTVVYFIVTL